MDLRQREETTTILSMLRSGVVWMAGTYWIEKKKQQIRLLVESGTMSSIVDTPWPLATEQYVEVSADA